MGRIARREMGDRVGQMPRSGLEIAVVLTAFGLPSPSTKSRETMRTDSRGPVMRFDANRKRVSLLELVVKTSVLE